MSGARVGWQRRGVWLGCCLLPSGPSHCVLLMTTRRVPSRLLVTQGPGLSPARAGHTGLTSSCRSGPCLCLVPTPPHRQIAQLSAFGTQGHQSWWSRGRGLLGRQDGSRPQRSQSLPPPLKGGEAGKQWGVPLSFWVPGGLSGSGGIGAVGWPSRAHGNAGRGHEAQVESRTEGKASILTLGKHELLPQQL